MKATCKCSAEQVMVEQDGMFGFIKNWGFFTWLLTAILTAATAGGWLACVIGWNISKILSPQYRCMNCGKVVDKKTIID